MEEASLFDSCLLSPNTPNEDCLTLTLREEMALIVAEMQKEKKYHESNLSEKLQNSVLRSLQRVNEMMFAWLMKPENSEMTQHASMEGKRVRRKDRRRC